MDIQIPSEEYARARAEFRAWAKRAFLIPMGHVAVMLAVSAIAYLIFWKWWILVIALLLIGDLAKKTAISEGYIYGFEYGIERGFTKALGGPILLRTRQAKRDDLHSPALRNRSWGFPARNSGILVPVLVAQRGSSQGVEAAAHH